MLTLRLLGSPSLEGPDGPISGRAALRQRVALLALLAVDHPRPLSRDKLLASLWPESGTDEARHHLRDTLYILRSALGEDLVLSAGDDVRLNPDRLTCDLWDFEASLARNDPETAVTIYRGPFLSGFHFSDAEEFERWAATERSRLARRYTQALEQVATRGGDPLRAVEWWARLTGEDPYNSRIALRYMKALDAAGDRAGALRHAGAHSDLLRTELDAAPEAEVVALAERLRLESRAAGSELPKPASTWTSSLAPLAVGSVEPRGHQWLLPTVLALAVGLGVTGWAFWRGRSSELSPRRVAVAVFENHTGRPDLDDLGSMTADWIIRGLMETPLIDVTDVEAVYADEPRDSRGLMTPRTLARRNGAGLVISGNYYGSGDSVLFHAGIVEVASGRVLRSFAPVGASVERPTGALEGLRKAVADGLGALMNPANQYFPVDPDLIPPPNYSAYREFIAGLRQGRLDDQEAEFRHYRRAAQLDSTFVAPLVQLAYRSTWLDRCDLTDSIGTVLDRRRSRLTAWDRLTIDLLQARCEGNMETAVKLLGQRFQEYPRSLTAKRQYSFALQYANQPRAAQQILSRLDPELDPGGRHSRDEIRAAYWGSMAASHHMLGQYRQELEITDRWVDSGNADWQAIRGRALGALGREREALESFQHMVPASSDAATEAGLTLASELAVHGSPRAAMVVADSILLRLERQSSTDPHREQNIAWANRLLGRKEQELNALGRLVRNDADTLSRLEAEGRIAVLLADTARAERIDKILQEQSSRRLRTPLVRAGQILARAHIAVGLGRREDAVALLQEASARGMLPLGASHAFHADLLLAPLRGYEPFDALLRPDK